MLLEILTGEGKSTTVSCLAAILAISGLAVDIVTTSQLLAERDVHEKRYFYQLLGLKVDHNFEENQKNEKKCYSNNTIVYGTPHSFQVDILLHDYKKRGTRGKRPFQVLIIDEVDSLFIDQKEHQTLLATTFPGFYELVKPMKIIWNKICTNPIFM
jgi:preprotein translocase subunit SecA